MNLIPSLTSHITDLAVAIEPAVKGSTVNLESIEKRNGVIDELLLLKVSLDKLLSKLSEYIHNAQKIQSQEIEDMYAFIGKLRSSQTDHVDSPTKDNAWTVIGNKRITSAAPPAVIRTKACRPTLMPITRAPASPNESPYTKVKFTEALALNAIPALSFDSVKQDGELYYIKSSNHFAFRLAGKLFHGNIGVIYTEERSPVKIKNCRFANQCIKKNSCDYYHDPVKFSGSTDHRNFIASSWLYSPRDSQFKNKTRSRRFGSRANLDMDILDLQEDETSRFHDQTMHDLLCSMLLMQYMSENTQ